MKRRILSLCLVLVLAYPLLSISVMAAEDEFVIENGVVVAYNGPGGDVIIPEGVREIGYQAFIVNRNITSVTFPNSLTKINTAAFLGCQNLSDINIPDGMKEIGVQAFWDTALTSVSIPSSVNSIGGLSFSGIYFAHIDVDTENQYYCSEDGVLFNKSKTVLVKYPDAKPSTSYTVPSGVKELRASAFEHCSAIEQVTLPDGLETIRHQVFQLSSLRSITMPSSVRTIGNAAFNCGVEEVYYGGDKNQWKQIDGSGADGLLWANIIYNTTDPDSVQTVATPTVTPNGGDFVDSQTIMLSCATPGAQIYYWMRNNMSSSEFALYTGPITITESEFGFFAFAVKDGMKDSKEVKASFYKVDAPHEKPGEIPNEKPGEGGTTPDLPTTPPGQGQEFKPNTVIPDWSKQKEDDIPTSWAKEEVQQAIAAALVPDDLQMGYRNPITREEFCRLMVVMMERGFGIPMDTYMQTIFEADPNLPRASFTDTDSAAVKTAYALGIVKGTSSTIFNPTGSITRQEAAAMLYRTSQWFGIGVGEGRSFDEVQELLDSGAGWAADAIVHISGFVDPTSGKAVMGGTGGNKFSPFATYSREQAILAALRMFHCK